MTQAEDRPAAAMPLMRGDSDIGAIGEIVGFHLRLAHGAVYRHFTETFAQLDLTQKQSAVLWLVDDHPGVAQTDLARLLQMDRATTMALINRLEAKGLLRRGKSPNDRREQTLELTAAGQAKLAEAKQAIGQHEDWLKARFTGKEVEKLIEFLTRIHQ